MKELSIEEKVKAYDEAIKYAYYLINERCKKGTNGSFHRADLQKMFPELKESEDKKIRKEIIDIINSYDVAHLKAAGLPSRIPEYIAWLENQGEHANFINNIQIGDKVTRNEDGVLVNLSQLKRVAKPADRQGEQKPADKVELSAFKNKLLELFLKFRHQCIDKIPTNEDIIEYVGAHVQELIDTIQKLSWSERDEENLNWFEKFFRAESVVAGGKDIPQDRYLWFKNLKNRVQPKQKWSEVDEQKIRDIYDAITLDDELEESYKEELYDFLKSLRPQNRWKPSDEQLEALESAAVNCAYSEDQDHLEDLIGQLKKLRGE